jgi:hypothetical protein
LKKEEEAICDAIPVSKLLPGFFETLTEGERRVVQKLLHSKKLWELVCSRLGELT